MATTEETRAQYRKRARHLKERLSRRTGCPVDELHPMALVEDLLLKKEIAAHDSDALADATALARLKQKPTTQGALRDEVPRLEACISKSTFRMYKASLRQHFSDGIESAKTAAEVRHFEEAMAVLNAASQCGYSKRGRSGSALKQKTFSERDFKAVMDALDDRIGISLHANAMRAFLNANRLVGLRPGEWEHASVGAVVPGSERLVLHVLNAKTTNGRGNGIKRTLNLDDLAPYEMDYLHEMVQLIEAIERGLYLDGHRRVMTFSKWMACMSEAFRRVTRSVFPNRKRRPTFYSLRHQVAADAKKSGGSRAQVAALLGHGSDATAARHYGRRVSGSRAQRVTASPENISTVRAKGKSRTDAPTPGPGT